SRQRVHCVRNTNRKQLQSREQRRRGIRRAYLPCGSLEEMRVRSCSQGMVLACPESSCWIRRAISSFQAASAPSSVAVSRLSIKEAASSARSSSERERAFCRRSCACRVMRELYGGGAEDPRVKSPPSKSEDEAPAKRRRAAALQARSKLRHYKGKSVC